MLFKQLVRKTGGMDRIMQQSITSPILLEDEFQKAFRRHETRRVRVPGGEIILEPVSGRPTLLLFGGGHVSKHISRLVAAAGFRVTVIDDRIEYANSARFPEAAHTMAGDFVESMKILNPTATTYIVIVTRGHRYDEEILEWAITMPARYIGMIGSKRKVLTTYERLAERGVSVEALQRVRASMGIPIGAATAEEIAVSIVAELISVRRSTPGNVPHKADEIKPLLEKLKNNRHHSAPP